MPAAGIFNSFSVAQKRDEDNYQLKPCIYVYCREGDDADVANISHLVCGQISRSTQNEVLISDAWRRQWHHIIFEINPYKRPACSAR